MNFSENLQRKINNLKEKRTKVSLGKISFDSPLLLAPMASICNAPFRLLMEDLGAGGTVSEFVSIHAIKHKNKRTMDMLKIDSRERNVGIQLFGEDPDIFAESSKVAESFGARFIDINMGCPVKKVVNKGGGSALMKNPRELGTFFGKIKKAIDIPLTIKIRMGWDADGVNADEIINIAHNEGIEFVAIHGRTRSQQYSGTANWNYIESLNDSSSLPLIGNGDLHHPKAVKERLAKTKCHALMIARGALRNPFIFLESYNDNNITFDGSDYFEIIQKLHSYTTEHFEGDRASLIQIRKLIVWFSSGFPNASKFRSIAFKTQSLDDLMKMTEDFFLSIGQSKKDIDFDQVFMNSGHG